MDISAHIDFRISGKNLCFEEINKTLNIKNPTMHKKGEIVKSTLESEEDTIIKEDSWLKGCRIQKKLSLESAVIKFLQPYAEHKDFIAGLSRKYKIVLWITLYPEDYQTNIALSPKALSILTELNAELAITYFYLVDIYNGTAFE